MDDASLDDFLDGGESTDEGDVDVADGDEADADAEEVVDDATDTDVDEADAGEAADGDTDATVEADEADEAVDPARSTMTFSPDPGECGVCGEPTARRWTDGDALVCRDCKEW